MLLSRLKIRTRIYMGFASLVVLGLVVAAAGSLGIDGLGRQSVRLSSLAGNQRYVAAAVQNEELISQILLRTRNESEKTAARRASIRRWTKSGKRPPKLKPIRCRPRARKSTRACSTNWTRRLSQLKSRLI
jgi:hypothetical protein